MSQQIPPDVIKTLRDLANALTNIETNTAEFIKTTPEQLETLSPLERARRDIAIASAVHKLYGMYSFCSGKDPNGEEDFCIDRNRIEDVKGRFNELEQRPNRPLLNKKVAKSYIRNALAETSSKVCIPSDDEQYEDLDESQTIEDEEITDND